MEMHNRQHRWGSRLRDHEQKLWSAYSVSTEGQKSDIDTLTRGESGGLHFRTSVFEHGWAEWQEQQNN